MLVEDELRSLDVDADVCPGRYGSAFEARRPLDRGAAAYAHLADEFYVGDACPLAHRAHVVGTALGISVDQTFDRLHGIGAVAVYGGYVCRLGAHRIEHGHGAPAVFIDRGYAHRIAERAAPAALHASDRLDDGIGGYAVARQGGVNHSCAGADLDPALEAAACHLRRREVLGDENFVPVVGRGSGRRHRRYFGGCRMS